MSIWRYAAGPWARGGRLGRLLGSGLLLNALTHVTLSLGNERPHDMARLVRLGVPLDAEHKAPAGLLDRLSQAVNGGAAADAQALAQTIDALMVMGLGGMMGLPRRARGQGASDQVNVVVGAVEGAGDTQMLVMAEVLGQMLQQGAAVGDVDQLHATADAEHRQVALDRGAHQGDFEAVALGDGVNSLRMGLLAIARRVDVGAAGEHQPVEQLE